MVWQGSPYPGLRSFTTEEASIFFGRGREVDGLIGRLRDPTQYFLSVVAASGTGKSSLIRAGLIPRLRDGAIEGSQLWRIISFSPGALGDNPLVSLAAELLRISKHPALRPAEVAEILKDSPEYIDEYIGEPIEAGLVIFIDQFEELFTLAAVAQRRPFLELLTYGVHHRSIRVIITLRSDFLSQCVGEPLLAALLQNSSATFPLGPSGVAALVTAIEKPAERSGILLEDGLVDEILRDAGDDPGALPLIAFCLEELYRQGGLARRLTLSQYQ